MSAWFIDALDGLSGQAFASYREIGQLDTPTRLEGPAWFVSAPDFAAEPVGGRATGLAATQRGLQLGLSVNGETEVPFASLDALVDYVRRLYLSGGGGDGPGGIDPAPGGPDGPEGPEDRDRSEERVETPETVSPLQGGLLNFATLVSQSSGLTGDATSFELPRLELSGEPSDKANDAAPLDHAAHLILAALAGLERDAAADDPVMEDRLGAAYQGYYAVLDLLDLIDRPDRPNEFTTQKSLKYWRRRPPADFIQTDIMDVLARLPVPRRVCQSISFVESWVSLKDLFFAVLGNPAHLLNTRFRTDRSALFVFAAAAIVQRTPHHRYRQPDNGFLMDEVLLWLRPQMPRFAFNPDLEATFEAIGRN